MYLITPKLQYWCHPKVKKENEKAKEELIYSCELYSQILIVLKALMYYNTTLQFE